MIEMPSMEKWEGRGGGDSEGPMVPSRGQRGLERLEPEKLRKKLRAQVHQGILHCNR